MSPQRIRPLEFGGGFAPDIPPSRAGNSFPDMENVILDPGGTGFQAIDGSTRLNTTKMDNSGGSSLAMIKFDPSIFGVATGVGLAIVDLTDDSKVLWCGVHEGSGTIDYTGAVTEIQALTRDGADQFPTVVYLQGQTYFCDGHDRWWLFDGKTTRPMGLPSSAFPVRAEGLAASEQDFNELASLTGWSAGGGNVTLTNDQRSSPIAGLAVLTAEITGVTSGHAASNVILSKTGITSVTPTADQTRFRFWIRADKNVPKNLINVRLGPSGSEIADIVIDTDLDAGIWYFLHLDYAGGASAITEWALEMIDGSYLATLPLSIQILGSAQFYEKTAGNMTGNYRATCRLKDSKNFNIRFGPLFRSAGITNLSAEQMIVNPNNLGASTDDVFDFVEYYVEKTSLGNGFRFVNQEADNRPSLQPGVTVDSTDAELTRGKQPQNFYDRPPSCKYATVYGERIMMCGQVSSTHSPITTVTGSNNFTGDTPQPWFQGKRIRLDSEDEIYTIFHASGVTWHICDYLREECQYQGSSAGSKTGEVFPFEGLVYFTSVISEVGAYSEAVPLQNQISVAPDDGDVFTGIAVVGSPGVCIVWKKKRIFMITQNFGVLDDDETQVAFNPPDILSSSIGCVAPRSIVVIPDGPAIFLGGDHNLYAATPDSVEVLPGMENVRSWFDDFTDAQIVKAVGGYESRNRQYVLYVNGRILRFDFRHSNFAQDELQYGPEIVSLQRIKNDDGVDQLVAGLTNGFIDRLYDGSSINWTGLGTVRYVASGTHSSTTMDFDTSTLPTTGDGLEDVWIMKIPAAGSMTSAEFRQITSNTATVVTTLAWTTTPVDGDIGIVGPIEILADFAELHFQRNASTQRVLIDCDYGADTVADWRQFQAAGQNKNADLSAASRDTRIDEALLDQFDIPLVGAVSSRAIRHRLHWTRRGSAGELLVRGVSVQEQVSAEDE